MFGECLRRASVEAVVGGILAVCSDVYALWRFKGCVSQRQSRRVGTVGYDARAQRPAFKRQEALAH
jgi:hypothetical protein